MKVLLVPDSMKDCLSAIKAARIMKEGVLEVFPFAEVISCPLSDGGEGLVEVLHEAGIGHKIAVDTEDPLGRNIQAFILELKNKGEFLIEIAQAAGIQLLKADERNPLNTSTRGVGLMIAHAINLGATKIYVGLGGSATHDLGCGMAEVLGAQFYNKENKIIRPTGGNLMDIFRVDADNLIKYNNVEFIGVSDVQSVLLGNEGAAYTFAMQKGATSKSVEQLEEGGQHLACLFPKNNALIQGSGAAGGLGFGLVTFLGGILLNGLEVLSRLTLLDEKIRNADIVLTLEGKTDAQTLLGKLPYSVALLAQKYNKCAIHYTGWWDSNIANKVSHPFNVVVPIQDKPMNVEESIEQTPVLLKAAVIRSFRLMKIGSSFNRSMGTVTKKG